MDEEIPGLGKLIEKEKDVLVFQDRLSALRRWEELRSIELGVFPIFVGEETRWVICDYLDDGRLYALREDDSIRVVG